MNFTLISIILYSASGLLFVVFAIMFFMTDVPDSIKIIKQKSNSSQNLDSVAPTINMVKNSRNNENVTVSENKVSDNINIEEVHNTTDADESDNDIVSFATLDDISDNLSFVLTRNIVICHNDKGY
ncbi:MAG: hypothetical protein K2G36_09835 [Ruminococcus sp.]|nr:hypothetical protein [Ruminococcus sp.]